MDKDLCCMGWINEHNQNKQGGFFQSDSSCNGCLLGLYRYILHGASSAVCQENTKWSTSSPECKGTNWCIFFLMLSRSVQHEQNVSSLFAQKHNKQLVCLAIGWIDVSDCALTSTFSNCVFSAVTCGLPPVPEYGILEFDIPRASMEHVEFGVKGTYKCLPPRALIGNPRAECTIYGNWTKGPVCQSK